jgi:hypothetical protein
VEFLPDYAASRDELHQRSHAHAASAQNLVAASAGGVRQHLQRAALLNRQAGPRSARSDSLSSCPVRRRHFPQLRGFMATMELKASENVET